MHGGRLGCGLRAAQVPAGWSHCITPEEMATILPQCSVTPGMDGDGGS
jgi:hypothetical protein